MKSGSTNAKIAAYIILTIVVPIFITLNAVKEPLTIQLNSANPTPLGYTYSLSIFLFPAIAIGSWIIRRKTLNFQRKAFWLTIAILAPTGIILDLLFGNLFFVFPNHQAITGIMIPGIGGSLPVEEFIFYITGFIAVLLIYIWCDEFWLEKYNIPDYKAESNKLKRVLNFNKISFIFALLLITFAIIYKKLLSDEPDGFPWYFIYLTLVALTPSMGLFDSAKHFINWRALSFTFFIIVLISLIWEVTLALPYQWWGFQHKAMMGIYIQAWHGLPIEEIVVWFSVTYASVIFYESIKIILASEKSIKQTLFGN